MVKHTFTNQSLLSWRCEVKSFEFTPMVQVNMSISIHVFCVPSYPDIHIPKQQNIWNLLIFMFKAYQSTYIYIYTYIYVHWWILSFNIRWIETICDLKTASCSVSWETTKRFVVSTHPPKMFIGNHYPMYMVKRKTYPSNHQLYGQS